MAKRTEKVIILETPADHEHWRTFVALLLLTQVANFGIRALSYPAFKHNNTAIWSSGLQIGQWIILGAALAGVSYALCHQSRFLKRWLALTAALWLGVILHNTLPASRHLPTNLYWFGESFTVAHPVVAYLAKLVLHGNDLGLLSWSLFLGATWYIVRHANGSGRPASVWPQLAAAWSFIYVLEATHHSWKWYTRLSWLGPSWLAIPHLLLPLLLGISFLRSSRFIVPLTLLVFLMSLGRVVVEPAMDLHGLYKDGVTYHFWVYLICKIGGGIVRYSLPWIIITVWAWRGPSSFLPDDGSPYPRRYCAQCHYNLHGIQSERCPECGEKIQD